MPSCCRFFFSRVKNSDQFFISYNFTRILQGAISLVFKRRIRLDGTIIDLWLDALEANLSSQISQIWRTAIMTVIWVVQTSQNKLLFDNEPTSIHSAITLIWQTVSEYNTISFRIMKNSMEELEILKYLHVKLKLSRSQKIIKVYQRVPP